MIDRIVEQSYAVTFLLPNIINIHRQFYLIFSTSCILLIIANINVNNLDLDSVIQCLYLINNLQESQINLFIYIIFIYFYGNDRTFNNSIIMTCA